MKLAIASVSAAAALATVAAADFTDLTYLGKGAYEAVTIVSPGYSGGLNAGQLNIALSNSTGSSGYLDGNHISFCADVYQAINGGPSQYSIVGVDALPTNAPMGALIAAGIGNLYAFAAGAQYTNDGAYACAFQLCIWEVINDYGNLDLSTGNFQASGLSGAALSYAAALLAAVGGNGSADLVGLASEEYQDLIIEVPAPGPLALLGIAGLAVTRRRRN